MGKILFCAVNQDTAYVELSMEDGTMLSIDCTAVENEVANSMYQRSELDWFTSSPMRGTLPVMHGSWWSIQKGEKRKALFS